MIKKRWKQFVAVVLVAIMVFGNANVPAKAAMISELRMGDDSISIQKIDGISDDNIRGMDLSSYLSLQNSFDQLNKGITDDNQKIGFRDYEGKLIAGADFFRFLAAQGVNYVRLRVWNDPYDSNGNGYGGGNNDINAAKIMGKWATDAGMKVLIDFHFSDFWADPGKQKAPKAWTYMSANEKADAISAFTTSSLNVLLDAGVNVTMVQIGNETNGAFCGETSWDAICPMLDAGCDAVHAVAKERNRTILAALHFTNPETAGRQSGYAKTLSEYDDGSGEKGVSYDVFATSYYPYWHGSLSNLTEVLREIASNYNKYVMVAETSWANTLDDYDGHENTVHEGCNDTGDNNNWSFTVRGQANEVRDVLNAVIQANTVITLEDGKKDNAALGGFYWEGAWNQIQNIYNTDGSVNAAKVSDNEELWEKYGSGWATSYSGEYDPDDAGKWYGGSAIDNQSFFGADLEPLDSLKVFNPDNLKYGLKPSKIENSVNLLENGGFEEYADFTPVSWISTGNGLDDKKSDPRSGNASCHWYSEYATSFTIAQTVTIDKAGVYTGFVYAQGMTGEEIDLMITVNGETYQSEKTVCKGWENWIKPTVKGIVITKAMLGEQGAKVTFEITGNVASGGWGSLDDACLYLDENELLPEKIMISDGEIEVAGDVILAIGDTKEFYIINEPEKANAGRIVWNSDHEEVVTVEDGIINAIAAGKAIITASNSYDSGVADCMEVYVKETVPVAKIDYENEMLTGLCDDKDYKLEIENTVGEKEEIILDNLKITEYVGKTIFITTMHPEQKCCSDMQVLKIPVRPVAPTVSVAAETQKDKKDGQIMGVTNAMEFKQKGDGKWIACEEESVTGLAAGEYQIRMKATETSFAGEVVDVTIGAGAEIERPDLTTEQPTTEKVTTEKNTTERETTEKNTTEKNTTERETTEKNTTERETTEKNTTERETTEKNTTERETTEKNTTEKNTTERETTEKNTTEKNTTERETTEKNTTERETTEKNTTEKETTEKKTTERETTEKETTEKKTTERETTEKETTERETAEEEMTERETTEKETTERETAEEEMTERETIEIPATEKESSESIATEKEVSEKIEKRVLDPGIMGIDVVTKSKYIVISNGDIPAVQYAGTTSVSGNVKIPDAIQIEGVTYKVTSIKKNTFKKNNKIRKVTIGNNIVKIETGAFNGCKNLKTVVMGKSVSTIGDKAFYKCTKLNRIVIPTEVSKIGKQAFDGCGGLKNITIQTSKLSEKNVGSRAFKGIYAEAVIKVPKDKWKTYKTFLKKKGIGYKVKVRK